jgi:Aspartyl protease
VRGWAGLSHNIGVTYRHAILAIYLAAAPMFAQFKPTAPRMVEVPLLDCSGLLCVELSAGSGKTLRLLIDLGEANAYLDTKAAQTLGLSLQALKGSDGGDINEVQQTVVPGARLGDLPLGDFPFMVLDTTPQPDKLGGKAEPLPGDGALTYGAFKNRLVEIDGRNHVMRISEPQSDAEPCPHECSDLLIKHVGNWGPVTLITQGFAVNGQPVDVQLDTLFTGTILIYPGAVEKLGLKKESKAKGKELFPYTQGGVKLARAETGAVTFRGIPLLQEGPLYFGTKDANLPAVQFDATVGMGVLSRATATFDFKAMHFWMDSAAAQ